MCYNNDGSNSNGLYIKQGGNVGIGTTSPSAKLEVAGIARFKTGTNLDIELGTPGGNTGVIFNRSESQISNVLIYTIDLVITILLCVIIMTVQIQMVFTSNKAAM